MEKKASDLAYTRHPNGRSLAQEFKSPDELNQYIKRLTPPYRQYVEFIKDEKVGPAAEMARQIKAEENVVTKKFLETSLGQRALRLGVLDKIMGPTFMKEFGAALFQDPNISSDVAAWVNSKGITDAIVQP